MNIIYIFVNFFLTALLAIVVFQVVPSLISSSDWLMVGLGFLLVSVSAAFVWARGVEIYNDIKNGEK